ncbi:MAG TPA: hypothetical protein VHA52_02755 [Candidatus Babeliaceae bacterium]|nr:hypothetical protein [Candidatus Babeliaceae bacterium]
MKVNVAIGFVTGRKHFQNVLKTYVNNWLEQGLVHDNKIRFHLFIAYDLKYHKTQIEDYKNIPKELAEMVDSINFYGSSAVEAEKNNLVASGALTASEAEMIFGEGYAKKRNVVSYFAIKKKMDRLIFIDDDEYPIAVLKNDYNKLVWMGQSVVGTHLNYVDDANITHGHHCGYISPIPYIAFNDILPEGDFRQFIEAISNDIISWEKIKHLLTYNQGVTYANPDVINHRELYEVKEEMGMKFISGANLCFNLNNVKDLPPFYNPPGARGEDAFMSTVLTHLKVIKVPCYTFHDGFMMYNHLLNGVLPTSLDGVTGNTPAVIRRFINATIGWMRYKPLLTYITQRDEYDTIMKSIEEKLLFTIPKMCEYFKTSEFNQVYKEFKLYSKKVSSHFSEFEATKKAWKTLMHSFSI